MAGCPELSQRSATTDNPPRMISIKKLSESPGLTTVPSLYTFPTNPQDRSLSHPDENIPTIDFSLLTSPDPDQRSKMIQQLGKACQEWGFFTVINHGVPENLMKAIIEVSKSFFELSEEEKLEFQEKHVLDPIRYGTSFNTSVDEVLFWRDFLKVIVHPDFHSPNKPAGFRDAASEYSKRVREIVRELLKGISASLGLEDNHIDKVLDLEKGLQILVANFYPSCPQPELAMGLPPHSDHGLLTILIQNEIGGLQVHHRGRWINVNAIPNSFLVNTADHLEILSNGKYKSVLHRAVVNNKASRLSVVVAHGPALDVVVAPLSELLDEENNPLAYTAMKYKDYLENQQSSKLQGKASLRRIKK